MMKRRALAALIAALAGALASAPAAAADIASVVVEPNPVVFSTAVPPGVAIVVRVDRGPLDLADCEAQVDPGDGTPFKRVVIRAFGDPPRLPRMYAREGTYRVRAWGTSGCGGQREVSVSLQRSAGTGTEPMQGTDWGLVQELEAGWGDDTMAVQHAARMVNPGGCQAANTGYATNPADPGHSLFHTVLLEAFLARKEVRLLVSGCVYGKPRILAVRVR